MSRLLTFSALLFLYREVVGRPLGPLGAVGRARAPARLPGVLTRGEVERVLEALDGEYRLIGMLLCGAVLRLLECLSLRVKDLDFERGEVSIRRGKGAKGRVTVFPERAREELAAHLEEVKALHASDLRGGAGGAAGSVGAEVSQSGGGMGMAVGLSGGALV